MDRAIFDLQTSVEATSLYILLCSVSDEGGAVTLSNAIPRWNNPEETIYKAAEELMIRGVLEGSRPIAADTLLHVTVSLCWH